MNTGASKVGLGESRYHSWGCHEVLMPNFVQYNKKKWRSEEFEVGGYRWRFLVFPKSDVTGKKEQYLSIFVCAVDVMELPLDSCPKAQIWLSVINHSDPIKTKVKETSHIFSKEVPSWGFSQFMAFKDVLEGWLTPAGSLHVRVFIKTECKRRVRIPRSRKSVANFDRSGSYRETSSTETPQREDEVAVVQEVGSGAIRVDPVVMIEADDELDMEHPDIQPRIEEIDDCGEIVNSQDKETAQPKSSVCDDEEVQQDRKELCVNKETDSSTQPLLDSEFHDTQSGEIQVCNSGSNNNLQVGDEDGSGECRNLQINVSTNKAIIEVGHNKIQQVVPQYSVAVQCNLDELRNIKHQMNSSISDQHVSEIHLIVKAIAMTLVKVPEVNMFDTQEIGEVTGVNILLVEHRMEGIVQRNLELVDKKGIPAIAAYMESSQSFRVNSSGNKFLVLDFRHCGLKDCSAILSNSFNVALCIGSAYKRIQNNKKYTSVMNFTLSCDERAIDKTKAAKWLEVFKGIIECPLSMLI